MEKNYFEKNIETKCAVCGNKYMTAILNIDPCPNCGWYDDLMCEEHENEVIYRNLVSLNKAKQLYAQGKPFEPNLDEFIEALSSYCEMQFEYNGVYYAVDVVDYNGKDSRISLYNQQTKEEVFFESFDDFKNNAKVEGKFLKEIWDKTTDKYWLQ